jgi:hypothetical protein
MSLKKIYAIALAITPGLFIIFGVNSPALAASVTYGDLIDDIIFDNHSAMSASQIDAFLNGFSGSCISSDRGFRAPDPTGYNPTNGFLYGSNATAGKVIYDAAQAYDLNPQVLLATLQKEQSLVTGGGGCSTLAYAAAMGYGCPDGGTTYSYSSTNLYTLNGHEVTSVSGTCVNTKPKVGFSQQIIHAAWLLKFDRERAEGKVSWYISKPNWDNSDDLDTQYAGYMTQGTHQRYSSGSATYYDGYATIDGTSIHIDDGATAALYDYTPHKAGNSNFVTIFDNWFGTTYAPHFQATYTAQSGYPTIIQGHSKSAYFKFKNSGNKPWFDNVSAPQYKTYAVHLATSNPLNHKNPFSASWPANNRAATAFAHVYEADGTTLAANQHIVEPGEIAEFSFNFTAPSNMKPGFYKEYFQPILEGSTLWNMKGMAWLGVTVQKPTFQATYAGQSGYPTIIQGHSKSAYFKFKNSGNMPWFDGASAPKYKTYAVHLATTNPINRKDSFSSGWPARNRATVVFAHVYEPDGVTLASNQHIVEPSEIAEFDLTFTAPSSMTPGFYKEYFQPMLEGSTLWNMKGMAWLGVTVSK